MLRTRNAMRRALLALLERKAFEQITVRDIAGEAHIGYATFFRHYSSKEELLDEIAADQIGRLTSLAIPLLNSPDTRTACAALVNYVGRHRALWCTLLTGGAAAALRAEFILLAKEGAADVRTRNWLPVELGSVYGVAATIEILTWWLRRPADECSAEQVADFLHRLVVAPATSSGEEAAAGDSLLD